VIDTRRPAELPGGQTPVWTLVVRTALLCIAAVLLIAAALPILFDLAAAPYR
jgi:hypothetical protein